MIIESVGRCSVYRGVGGLVVGGRLVGGINKTPKKVINLYISYRLGPQLRDLNTDFTLGNCLFGSAKLTNNADLDKYKYSSYGIGFDSRSEFSLPEFSFLEMI